MWTLMLGPAVTIPVFSGPSGLPLGAQITGPRGGDGSTLLCAEWVQRALAE
jgi:Asp-tRNA(Asn)/Glu-tRNA(Gln) amidotransferase A subunit family amidase